MIETKYNFSYEMSDSALLTALGAFVRETRLVQNKTQEEVSAAAGIKRMTLLRIEKGRGGTMGTFVRVLRTLQQLHILNEFQIPTQISPLKLAKLEQNRRLRARSKKPSNRNVKKKSDW